MPIISQSRGYLFVLSPRTASSAVATGVLIPHLDGSWLPTVEVVDPRSGRVLVAQKHAPLSALLRHGVLTSRQSEALLKFTTVRNPFDSMVSLFVKQRDTYQPMLDDPTSWVHRRPHYVEAMVKARQEPFGAWVRFVLRPRSRRQRMYAAVRGTYYPRHLYRTHMSGMDVVLRHDSLQDDFDRLTERLGVTDRLIVPQLNVTEAKTEDFRSFYDADTKAFAERVFAPDMMRFGYSC